MNLVIIKPSTIKGAGMGAFANQLIPKGQLKHEYVGLFNHSDQNDHSDYSDNQEGRYKWSIFPLDKVDQNKILFDQDPIGFVDAYTSTHWTRYVNGSSNIENANIDSFQKLQKLYYINNKDIQEGEELLVWYGQCYTDLFINNSE